MEFPIRKESNPNIRKYEKEDLAKAYEFSKLLYGEFGEFVKAIVLFGSAARRERGPGGDIDILVIVDDVSQTLTREIAEAYRIIIQKIISDVDRRLHVTTLRLSSFWEYVRAGDPIGMNILRDGVALLDSGFFDPMRALLMRGRIRPSKEAIWTYFARAPRTIHNSKWHVLQGAIDLYWAAIDATHAALMKQGITPPSPEHAGKMLQEHLVSKGLIDKKHAKTMDDLYRLQKDILHRKILDLPGRDFDAYMKQAEEFVEAMEKFINQK